MEGQNTWESGRLNRKGVVGRKLMRGRVLPEK